MLKNIPVVKTMSIDFEKGSTLVMLQVNGKDVSCFVGESSRLQAVWAARDLKRSMYDAEDARRKERGLPKVSRPNV